MRYIANPVAVDAWVITGVGPVFERRTGELHGSRRLTLEDGREVIADGGMLARYTPIAGDFWVQQDDGYEYVNPKHVFERKYRKSFEQEDVR